MTNGREQSVFGKCVLRDRDRRLLADLFLHRTMSRDQIIALGHFGSVPRCNNRLRHLLDHGYVRRYKHSARGSGSQALYCLGRSGAPVVAERLDLPIEEVRLQTERDAPTMFLEHTLGLVDLRILFGRAAISRGLQAYDWLPEPLCRHEYSVRRLGSWVKCILKPDAYACWNWMGEARAFFIELDLGNVSERAFQHKIEAYRRYLDDGAFTEAYELAAFAVLTVTTGDRRLRNLAELTDNGCKPRFLFTTLAELQEMGLEACFWTDGKKSLPLLGGYK